MEHLLARSGTVNLDVSNDYSNEIDFSDIYDSTTLGSTNDDFADLIPEPEKPLPKVKSACQLVLSEVKSTQG